MTVASPSASAGGELYSVVRCGKAEQRGVGMRRILRFFDADRIIIGGVCVTVFLYGGRWIDDNVMRPIVHRPPPGMMYLAAPVRAPFGANFAYLCEGCVYKK